MTSINYSSITQNLVTSGTREVSVNGGRPVKRKVLLPAISAQQSVFLPIHRTIPADIVNPQMFSGVNSMQTITIRRGDLYTVDHLMAKITVLVSGGSVVLAQLPLWFNQINLRTSDGNTLIATAYSDTLITNLLTAVSNGRMKSLFKSLNIDYSPAGYLGTTNALMPGTYTFYLPLFSHSVIGNFQGLQLAGSNMDLSFDFFPNNPVVSGTGSISLSAFAFVIEGNQTTERDVSIYQQRYAEYSTECVFVDPVLLTLSSKLLNAGSVNLLSLNQLVGLCSHQLVIVRPVGTSYSNVGGASFNWLNVGDAEGAAIDLVDTSSNSIWGNGSPVSTRFMRTHIAADMCDNAFIATKCGYTMTYCNSILGALQGSVKGAYKFDGSTLNLALTLPPAPQAEIQTVTFSQVPSAAGNYRFSFRGECSVDLAATATPAQMSAALAGLKGFSSQYITAVASASVSSGASFSLTFTHPATSGLEGDLVSVVSDGLAATNVTSRTQNGQAGLATGLYDVSIYSYLYRSGSYINGRMRSDLMNCC